MHTQVTVMIALHREARLRFGMPLTDIVRFTNLLTYLLTYHCSRMHAGIQSDATPCNLAVRYKVTQYT